jgi:hypothetical protein
VLFRVCLHMSPPSVVQVMFFVRYQLLIYCKGYFVKFIGLSR